MIPRFAACTLAMIHNPLLDVIDLQAAYGLSRVLFGVSITVQRGEIVSLLGRNGVGKTTLLRAIMGLLRPSAGHVVLDGRDITRRAPHKNARDGIGYVPEDRRIFGDLTVWENLDIGRRDDNSRNTWNEESVFELFPDLRELRYRKGGLLSGGQQQMLTVARSLMGNPELLLLDEPSEGLAPLVVEKMRQRIAELRDAGLAIVLAEQSLEFVLSLSDRVYILEKGEVKYSDTAEKLREASDVQNTYLYV